MISVVEEKSIRLNLSYSEVLQGANIGVMRMTQNFKLGRKEKYGQEKVGTYWETHINGALGEMACAKALGLFWSGNLGNISASDVGPYQVRTITRENNRLILHPEDADDDVFILVYVDTPSFVLEGWIYGKDGKDNKFWTDPSVHKRPAYFVPKQSLNAMSTIPIL